MTDVEKMILVRAMTEEENDDVISAFLSMAGEAIVNLVDPHSTTDKDAVLERYGGVQIRIASAWLNKRGADGQISHSENGISRGYESGDIPASILRELTPICGVTK